MKSFGEGQLDKGLAVVASDVLSMGAKPFFGTLLGLVREGKTIDYDSDVDFVVEKGKLVPLLTHFASKGVECHYLNQGPLGLGVLKVYLPGFFSPSKQTGSLKIDFFIYRVDGSDSFAEFDTHWSSDSVLKVPHHWLNEIQLEMDGFSLRLTGNGDTHETICAYLYGENWRERKRVWQYEVVVDGDGVPAIQSVSRFQYLHRFVTGIAKQLLLKLRGVIGVVLQTIRA